MTFAVTAVVGVVAGAGAQVMNAQHAKKMAGAQAALGREQSAKLQERASAAAMGAKREIDTLRLMRSMDVPAFRQASENAVIQAQKGAERMARHVTMSRLPGEVNQAIFGGQFQQYVGQENQKLQQYAGLTQQILQASERQQEKALGVSGQMSAVETSTQSEALRMEAAAGSLTGNILGAVGSAASSYASGGMAKAAAAKKAKAAGAREDRWLDIYEQSIGGGGGGTNYGPPAPPGYQSGYQGAGN